MKWVNGVLNLSQLLNVKIVVKLLYYLLQPIQLAFFSTIRMGTREDIVQMFKNMTKIRENIIESVISLVYFMPGSVQYNNVMSLSYYERQVMNQFIERRLEIEKNKINPVC